MCFEATASANIATTLIIVMAEALHVPVQQQLFHTIIKLIIINWCQQPAVFCFSNLTDSDGQHADLMLKC
jgi:hypothetical protein